MKPIRKRVLPVAVAATALFVSAATLSLAPATPGTAGVADEAVVAPWVGFPSDADKAPKDGCRLVSATNPSLAHPLQANPEGFEPLVVEEDAGTRIVTPYYSVLMPMSISSDQWSFSYSGALRSWGMGLPGYYRGCQLTIQLPKGTGCPEALYVYVTSTDWTGVQGAFAAQVVGNLKVSDDFQIVTAVAADFGDSGYREQVELVASLAEWVTADVVAADAAAGDGPEVLHVSERS